MKQLVIYMANLICFCLLLLFFFSFGSCKKFITAVEPKDEITTDTVFTSTASATAAVLGIYRDVMIGNPYNGSMTLYPGLSADELQNAAPNAVAEVFVSNKIPPSNSNIRSFWSRSYDYLYQVNACIEGLSATTSLTPAVKNQLLGEVKFLRAFFYFYMTNLYGEVPLVLSKDYRTNMILPRAPVSAIYGQVVNDLKDAIQLLPSAYVGNEKLRPNKWTATALLARVFLYQKKWPEAEEAANSVINSGQYSLVQNLNSIFLSSSQETLWQMQPVATSLSTGDGTIFIPSSATTRPAYVLTPALLGAFESQDNRKTAWVKTVVISNISYSYPFKYKIRTTTTPTEYNIVLRLAELYLVRAEARAEQLKLTEAAQDLNRIRSRAGLPGTTAASKDALLLAIEKERQLELFAEWGHRWFDLKRNGQINAVLSAAKTTWTPTAALYPVPLAELDLNPFLTQNPGY